VPYADRVLICRNCGGSFNFTAGEQTFYANRGLVNTPSRCPACRNARRAGGQPPGDGYVHYGPFASFGGRTPRQMHPATCDRCSEVTEVPFLPRGDRPVFCPECFDLVRQAQEPPRLSASP
jgi:CxxC-x17-CxxC domain-containing protein